MDMLSNAYKLSEKFRFEEVATKHKNFFIFSSWALKPFNELVLNLSNNQIILKLNSIYVLNIRFF